MPTRHNYLQYHRKQSSLTQADIAFLMDQEDHSNLSRCEKGQRTPPVEMLLAYHILFDVSIESFFQVQKRELQSQMLKRITELRDLLKARDKIPRGEAKIRFLESTITRLTTHKHYDQ